MTFGKWLSALSLAIMLPVGPAIAQLGGGQSGHSTLQFSDREGAMLALASYGRCFAKTSTKEALALMRTNANSPEEAAFFRKEFRSEQPCMLGPGEMSGPLAYYRGAIAEGLVKADAAVPVDLSWSPLPLGQVRNLTDAARCFVPANRDAVRALLQTKLGSRNEFNAIQAMLPEFKKCVPVDGQRFDPSLLRMRLAEALWRTSAEPKTSS